MAKTYKFNMSRNGHNIDTAMVMLRNRAWDAEKAGDKAAAKRIWERHERLSEAAYYMNGMIEVTWEEWKLLKAASDWAVETRMARCEAAGIEYVD